MYACACYFTAPKTCRSRPTENTLKIEDQDQTSKVLKRGEESPTKAADRTIECSKSSLNLSVWPVAQPSQVCQLQTSRCRCLLCAEVYKSSMEGSVGNHCIYSTIGSLLSSAVLFFVLSKKKSRPTCLYRLCRRLLGQISDFTLGKRRPRPVDVPKRPL